ncbi:NAD(P)-binding protein [Nadsonia fulvescens var. elongata DSM 6958]|uniref:NAD(P)-binding protein n=1 Tax=Nadsonia fulvescens var. elongata DSM 6958 TaxID=857566 RepID=A0A1E3PIP7_9ASCO|nr:NAD(P)-binding protein [Nadsonia fulvescens var. elongata DSM 6958]
MDPIKINGVMRAWGLAKIIVSKKKGFNEGDLVYGLVGFSEFVITNGTGLNKIEVPSGDDIVDVLGVLGLNGLTAYAGLFDVAHGIKKGDRVVGSGAAGATDSIVGQIAKTQGVHIVGIAGSNEKHDVLLNEFNFNVALNYKKDTFKQDFIVATNDGIGIYWDNVGGEILELALEQASNFPNIINWGCIAEYNKSEAPIGIRNYFHIVTKRLTLRGFICSDHYKIFGEARKELSAWLASGQLKAKSAVLTGRMEKAPEALAALF